jgi:hypothetical protein
LSFNQASLFFLLRLLSGHVVVADVADGGRVGLQSLDLRVIGDLGELAFARLKVSVILRKT